MGVWILEKNKVKPLCERASGEWETYVPLETSEGDVHFICAGNEISLDGLKLDYEALVIPPKVAAFPQLEALFHFKDGKITDAARSPAKKLFFGLRACDVRGILFADDFFRRNFEDVYYLNRTAEKLLVVVGCTHPLENCFCTSAKTGPFLPSQNGSKNEPYAEFDLQLIDVEDEYVVETGSGRGEEFISAYSEYFENGSEDDVKRAEKAKTEAEKAVSLKVDFEGALKKFRDDNVPVEIYKEISERCIYCGGCLYVCPTCTCFSVFDDGKEGTGARYRNWDACVFEGYTREASGHNPRTEKWVRTSRRYEHKLKYDYLATGVSGCVGCGRCLSTCPVGIGISQVIERVTKE